MIIYLIFGLIFGILAVLALYILLMMYVKKKERPELLIMITLFVSIILGIFFSAYALNKYFNHEIEQVNPIKYNKNVQSV